MHEESVQTIKVSDEHEDRDTSMFDRSQTNVKTDAYGFLPGQLTNRVR